MLVHSPAPVKYCRVRRTARR